MLSAPSRVVCLRWWLSCGTTSSSVLEVEAMLIAALTALTELMELSELRELVEVAGLVVLVRCSYLATAWRICSWETADRV